MLAINKDGFRAISTFGAGFNKCICVVPKERSAPTKNMLVDICTTVHPDSYRESVATSTMNVQMPVKNF